MSLQKNAIIFTVVFFSFGCNGAEDVPEKPTFSQILPADKAELLAALKEHTRKIAEDFREKGDFYKAWQNDENSESLRFSFSGNVYNLRETMKLSREILEEIKSPVLFSNFLEWYVDKDAQSTWDRTPSILVNTLFNCIDIGVAIEDESELIAMIMSFDLMTDQICIYDGMSYFRYIACKTDFIVRLEKMESERFSRVTNQIIIALLNKISTDIDTAFKVYLISERAIVASVAASLLKNEEEYKEAMETIRYISSIIGKSELELLFVVRDYGRTVGPPKTQSELIEEFFRQSEEQAEPISQPETGLSEISENFIKTRTEYVPSILTTNRALKHRVSILTSKFKSHSP